jgi:hypothetical protein
VTGEIRVESLVMNGVLVEDFASALVEDVVELGFGSLDGLNERANLGEQKDGAPRFKGSPGFAGQAAKGVSSGTSGVRREGELLCKSQDVFVSSVRLLVEEEVGNDDHALVEELVGNGGEAVFFKWDRGEGKGGKEFGVGVMRWVGNVGEKEREVLGDIRRREKRADVVQVRREGEEGFRNGADGDETQSGGEEVWEVG